MSLAANQVLYCRQVYLHPRRLSSRRCSSLDSDWWAWRISFFDYWGCSSRSLRLVTSVGCVLLSFHVDRAWCWMVGATWAFTPAANAAGTGASADGYIRCACAGSGASVALKGSNGELGLHPMAGHSSSGCYEMSIYVSSPSLRIN
jgi:hypothetical protein